MKQEYAEYLAEKARQGNKSAWHQLQRAGIEIEVDEFDLPESNYRIKPINDRLYHVKDFIKKDVRPDWQNLK